jgi:hypothetical protein
MSEKEKLVLSDPLIKPDEKLISSFIGDKIKYWNDIINFSETEYQGISGVWNYYNDGKQWLFKLVQKKKTIFWAGILPDTFRITFYFGDKAEPLINASSLPQAIKDDFATGKRYGKIRGITKKMNKPADVEIVKKLIAIKVRLK